MTRMIREHCGGSRPQVCLAAREDRDAGPGRGQPGRLAPATHPG